MITKWWILGAGGMIGKSILNRLKQDGQQAVAVSDHCSQEPLEADRIQYISWKEFDLQDNPYQKNDAVIYCAGSSLSFNQHSLEQWQDMLVQKPLHYAKKAFSKNAPKKWIHLSSGAVYQNQSKAFNENDDLIAHGLGTYASLKSESEFELLSLGESIQTARIFSLLGPGLSYRPQWACWNFLEQMKAQKDLVIHDSKGLRSWIDLETLARWLLELAPLNEIGPVNMGGHERVTLGQLAYLMKGALGYQGTIIENASQESRCYVPDLTRLDQYGLVEYGCLKEYVKSWIKEN